MWDVIYEPPWMLSAISALVAISLMLSLLVSLVQSRRLRQRITRLQKELSVMSECSMGMGDKLTLLERVFSQEVDFPYEEPIKNTSVKTRSLAKTVPQRERSHAAITEKKRPNDGMYKRAASNASASKSALNQDLNDNNGSGNRASSRRQAADTPANLTQESRYRKANHLLLKGESPEAVMQSCGVSKAEIDLMRLLEGGRSSSALVEQ